MAIWKLSMVPLLCAGLMAAQTRPAQSPCASKAQKGAGFRVLSEKKDPSGIRVQDVFVTGEGGCEIPAYIITPPGRGPFPAVLYVHWLGEHHSDRTEFMEEAMAMAAKGVKSLLLQAPWAQRGWFNNRKLEEDYDFSVREVRDLGHALDVLASARDVDHHRTAFVGHDFGAMYGASLLSHDRRVHYAVLMAATPDLSDWFLLGRKLSETDEAAYRARMQPFDARRQLPNAGGIQFLFQFSNNDKYVPKPAAEAFAGAAQGEHQVLWYDAPHELDQHAQDDRVKWLLEVLHPTQTHAGLR